MKHLPKRSHSCFGYLPDLPDYRDLHLPRVVAPVLPRHIDLSLGMPPCFDQGELGSCTANAIEGGIVYLQIVQNRPIVPASRLFIYYNERVMEGTVGSDSGAMIRDGIKSVNKLGAPPETLWPYKIRAFKRKPTAAAYTEALKHQALKYQRVPQSLRDIFNCLAVLKRPIVFGFSVYENFWDIDADGVMKMPAGELRGGHAVLAMGYDQDKQLVKVRNSWGPKWGDKGYFYMPYEYIQNVDLCDDFWQMTLLE